jgi:hypothetical protein
MMGILYYWYRQLPAVKKTQPSGAPDGCVFFMKQIIDVQDSRQKPTAREAHRSA